MSKAKNNPLAFAPLGTPRNQPARSQVSIPRSSTDGFRSSSTMLFDEEDTPYAVNGLITDYIDESGKLNDLKVVLTGVAHQNAHELPGDIVAVMRQILGLGGESVSPPDEQLEELSRPADDITEQMLEKLKTLRERPLSEGDSATPSRAAIGALEDIVSLLPEGSVIRKPSIGSDGIGGAQIIWKFKKTYLIVSASASEGAIVPDVYMFFRKNGVREATERFETSKEFADCILKHLPLFEA